MDEKQQKIADIKTAAIRLAMILKHSVKIEIDVNPEQQSTRVKITESY